MRGTLFVVVLTLLLSACTTQDKPVSWGIPPEQEKKPGTASPHCTSTDAAGFEYIVQCSASRDCPNITGVYSNAGEDAKGNKHLLAVLLKPRAAASNTMERLADHEAQGVATLADTVELSIEKGSILRIKAVGDGFQHEWVLDQAKKQFSCESNILQIELTGIANVANHQRVTVGAFKLQRVRNHLVIEQHNVFVGLVKSIPKGQYENIWLRFPVHAPPGKTVTTGAQTQSQEKGRATMREKATTGKPPSSVLPKPTDTAPAATKKEPRGPQKDAVQ